MFIDHTHTHTHTLARRGWGEVGKYHRMLGCDLGFDFFFPFSFFH